MKKKLRYDMIGCGPIGHPEKVMKDVAEVHNFKIISSECFSIGDCWVFEIETENELSYMPCYIREI